MIYFSFVSFNFYQNKPVQTGIIRILKTRNGIAGCDTSYTGRNGSGILIKQSAVDRLAADDTLEALILTDRS